MNTIYNPINNDFVDDVQINPDRAHGDIPNHVDVRIQLPELPGVCQKLRVTNNGNIFSDDLEFGNRFFNNINQKQY